MSDANDTTMLQLDEVLDDLCIRFIVNLPAVEYESFERFFFAIESAHWFYDDFYREKNPSLPRLPLKHFAAKLFNHTNFLHQYRGDVDRLTSQFQSYKQEVPTCGAALLNPAMDKILLVRGWGNNAKWGFPKGKLSKDETELEAATREVFEETGFDIRPHVDESTFFIDSLSGGKLCRIFIVPDIPEDTCFQTRTRKEISAIDWVPIAALPDSPKNAKLHTKAVLDKDNSTTDKSRKFLFAHYGVAPYTKRIRSWIKRRRKLQKQDLPSAVSSSFAPISVQELEASLSTPKQSSASAMSAVENGLLASNIPSSKSPRAEELQNGNGDMQFSSDAKRKGSKNRPKSSPKLSRNSRKEGFRTEAMRNQMTFGNCSAAKMDKSQKDKLFRQYVLETDRIVAEKGLRDDFWPVPYIKSSDFTAEEVKEAEEARKSMAALLIQEQGSFSKNQLECGAGHQETVKRTRASKVIESFAFDREAILACINASGVS